MYRTEAEHTEQIRIERTEAECTEQRQNTHNRGRIYRTEAEYTEKR